MGWSGLWNREYGENYSALGSNNTAEFNSTTNKAISKRISRDRGGRKLAEILRTLVGATAGSTAAVNHVQIAETSNLGNPTAHGGSRTIETIEDVNRATTAADVTVIQGIIDQVFAPSSYPTDAAGNGGGGKVGKF